MTSSLTSSLSQLEQPLTNYRVIPSPISALVGGSQSPQYTSDAPNILRGTPGVH